MANVPQALCSRQRLTATLRWTQLAHRQLVSLSGTTVLQTCAP